jgi:flagellar motor switch protein FliN/FliY
LEKFGLSEYSGFAGFPLAAEPENADLFQEGRAAASPLDSPGTWIARFSMSELSAETIEQVLVACHENQSAIAESLNLCFNTQYQLALGDPAPWEKLRGSDELSCPGLLVNLNVGDAALLVAIPAAMPLPAWYKQPNENESARLNTLPMEWALSFLPEEMAPDGFACQATENLLAVIGICEPIPGAVVLPLELAPVGGGPAATLWLIGPVAFPPPAPVAARHEPRGSARMLPPREETISGMLASDDSDRAQRIRQLMQLPVPVIVKLAEKRIQLGKLLSLGPGAIVIFEKSCEDLLELCVNNQVYCRGEAVKIGEKFGLKVNEIGTLQERQNALRG